MIITGVLAGSPIFASHTVRPRPVVATGSSRISPRERRSSRVSLSTSSA
jgi:hypothetical protein